MAVAPVVEYFRLVDDGTGTDTFQFENPAAPTAASLLDFGTVDAGTNTYEGTNANLTAALAGCQVYAIFNNRAGATATSDMQNTTLSVVSNEAGAQGNSAGTVYENKWINVLLNDGVYGSDDVALGKAATDLSETKLDLTALGLNVGTDGGTIKGTTNGGTLSDTDNFARIKVWVDIAANAPAGPHLFRLRTTYSYT